MQSSYSLGQILSHNITTAKEMQRLGLPRQGTTNIPSGVEKALRVIFGREMHHLKCRKANSRRTHHILILLSDGQHNSGPTPEQVFPTLGDSLLEGTKLSVIVVGFSQQSSTSMGMLLKKSVETVAFDADMVQTIYFASTRAALKTSLARLKSGLDQALAGSFHDVKTDSPLVIQDFASEPVDNVRIHVKPGSSSITLLCSACPKVIYLDEQELSVTEEEDASFESLSSLIQGAPPPTSRCS